MLSIVMHYSRISTPVKDAYSPATAVLLNELLKGSISFVIALMRTSSEPPQSPSPRRSMIGMPPERLSWWSRFSRLCSEIFSRDCFKLSIPAILYVIQNSLQFVAISNLPVASFQVAYQMKILTTAAFSVALLRKSLTRTKWTALFFLALGVGIVQIQTTAGGSFTPPKHSELVGSAAAAAPRHMHVMEPLKGFAAVIAACFTSGLAGVYFEMVLKNSKADLWVRNVQLSLFSLLPALLPILISPSVPGEPSQGLLRDSFKNFGGWAWATVAIQVFGGLVTAIVIKYSDNILKGFATSLSIIISFLASVVLFDFHLTYGFLVGSSTVLAATWMYNQPSPRESQAFPLTLREKDRSHVVTSPVNRADPILGEKPSLRKLDSLSSSSQSLSSLLGISAAPSDRDRIEHEEDVGMLSHSSRTASRPHFTTSPYASRPPSPFRSEPPTPGLLYPSTYSQRPL